MNLYPFKLVIKRVKQSGVLKGLIVDAGYGVVNEAMGREDMAAMADVPGLVSVELVRA